MISQDKRYIIAYNGEIYNHLAIRSELQAAGHCFKGSSDTETILAAISQWGLNASISRCIGMFAMAVWDTQEQTLSLVRDRMGIKPLYYGLIRGGFVFGSELKALGAHPGFGNAINRGALSLFFRHAYIPGPHSIFAGIHKLEPGTILRIGPDGETSQSTYWSAKDVWLLGRERPFAGSRKEAADALEELLLDAVKIRMLSDVPVGAFLSGGIDSSTVVALMQKASPTPTRTFSIGFNEPGYDEAPMAAAIARHLGTLHTEFYVTPNEILEVVLKLPELWDEPFGDSSQIPTYILSRITRQAVTVSLSGDGGDELFHGYQQYFHIRNAWQKVSLLPYPLRAAASRICLRLLALLEQDNESSATKRLRLAGIKNLQLFYKEAISQVKQSESLVIGVKEPFYAFDGEYGVLGKDNHRLMPFLDIITYLPDDILVKIDRASMGVSLEARVPLLDHRVVELAASFSPKMNMHNGVGKQILRQVLERYVPRNLFERPKKGFGIPLATWLRHELREWAEPLLSRTELTNQGILNPNIARKAWCDFINGDDSRTAQLWNILMFQSWFSYWTSRANANGLHY